MTYFSPHHLNTTLYKYNSMDSSLEKSDFLFNKDQHNSQQISTSENPTITSSQISSDPKPKFHKETGSYKKQLQNINTQYSKGEFNSGLCCRRGVLLDLLGHTNEAIQMYIKSIELSSHSNLVAYNNLANLFIRNGQFQKAEGFLTKILNKIYERQNDKNLPLLPMFHINRGICYLKMENYGECEKDVRKAKKIMEDEVKTEQYSQNGNHIAQKGTKIIQKVFSFSEILLNNLEIIKKLSNQNKDAQIKEKGREVKKCILQSVSRFLATRQSQQKQVKKVLRKVQEFKEELQLLKVKEQINLEMSVKFKKDRQSRQFQLKEVAFQESEQSTKLKKYLNENYLEKIYTSEIFSKMIEELQKYNSSLKVYLLKLYWVLVSYFIAYKIIGKNSQNKRVQIKKLYEKIKIIFNHLSKQTLYSSFCEAISKFFQLYGGQEILLADEKIFIYLQSNFPNDNDIFEQISDLLMKKMKQISQYLEQKNSSLMSKKLSVQEKAADWFKKRKQKIISKIKLNITEIQWEKVQVLDDMGFILWKITANCEEYEKVQTVLNDCFDINLRKSLIAQKYAKANDKKTKEASTQTCRCLIFNVQIQKTNSFQDFFQERKLRKYLQEDRELYYCMLRGDIEGAKRVASTMDLNYILKGI